MYFEFVKNKNPLRLKDDLLQKIYSTLPEAMVPLMNQSLRYNPAKFHERNEAIDAEFGYAK